jgi:hypothetical protein
MIKLFYNFNMSHQRPRAFEFVWSSIQKDKISSAYLFMVGVQENCLQYLLRVLYVNETDEYPELTR